MIDKRALTVIGVLIILAFAVLIVALISPSFGGGGSSFSALFDRLERDNASSELLVLPADEFEEDQEITVKDKIISMRVHGDDTYFAFVYTGNDWVNETGGTEFVVPDGRYNIVVEAALFEIRVDGKYSASFDVGDTITLQTTVVEDDDKLVFDHEWEVLVS